MKGLVNHQPKEKEPMQKGKHMETRLQITEPSVLVIETSGDVNFGGGPQLQQLVVREFGEPHPIIDVEDDDNYPMVYVDESEPDAEPVVVEDLEALLALAGKRFELEVSHGPFSVRADGTIRREVSAELTIPTLPLELRITSARAAERRVVDVIRFVDMHGDAANLDDFIRFRIVDRGNESQVLRRNSLIGDAMVVQWATKAYPLSEPAAKLMPTNWAIGFLFGEGQYPVLSRVVPAMDAPITPQSVVLIPA